MLREYSESFWKDEAFDQLIKYYFELESMGINESVTRKSKHDRALNLLEKTSHRVGDCWGTGLLWEDDHAPMLDSRLTAGNRLGSL